MDRPIKPYKIDGTFKSDSDMERMRDKFNGEVEELMREDGHVPVLDMGVKWIVEWNKEKDSYDFAITKWGVYVGKRKARELSGWDSKELKWY